ncbi:la-related protein 1A-like isoform X4 [Salvia divinorum]|uniref:La-related protein 1A-like isoform X4 n=1 Tax=Salvia divinorum TaxID=28513 RepID=A0ABD1HPD5_SALDI
MDSLSSPLVPYPLIPEVLISPLPLEALRTNIVKQIENYFRDKNMGSDDVYLISLMDNQARSRRRNEWSKWIPKSVNTESISLVGNSMNINIQSENTSGRKAGISAIGGSSLGSSIKSSTGHCKDSEEQRVGSGKSNLRLEQGSQPSSKNKTSVLNDGSNFQENSLEADSVKSVLLENGKNNKMQDLSISKVKNFGKSSGEFSSTFMLDEELELEQKMTGCDPSSIA